MVVTVELQYFWWIVMVSVTVSVTVSVCQCRGVQ